VKVQMTTSLLSVGPLVSGSGSGPMSLERLLLLLGGVVAVLFGLFADLFIPPPRRIARVGIAILGVVAICTVVWQQWHKR
jgi:hypothetical protein